MFTLVEKANTPGWLQEYGDMLTSSAGIRLELEQCARVMRCYESQFVPDLLQTTDYARALLGRQHPGAQPAEIERRFGLLMKRQEALRQPEACRLWAVIDEADLHDPDKIVDAAAKILDLSEPVALILSGIMGHIADDEGPHAIVGRLMDRRPAGSYLMLQDGTTVSQANADALEDYNESGAIPYNLRTPEEIARYFDGLDVVEPGVIPIEQWRPEAAPAEPLADVNTFGGIGRKR
jgi:hypothetical protein